MTRLIVVRHGESRHNDKGVLGGRTDAALTETGVRQAERLAARLADEEDVAAIYSSDLERARQTAQIVADVVGVEYVERKTLRERDWGVFEGEQVAERDNALDHGDDLDTWRPEDGENIADMKERVLSFVADIEEEYPDETVVLVAHAWTNRALITGLLASGEGHAHQIRQGNTAINVLEKEPFRGWRIESLNDTRHAEPVDS